MESPVPADSLELGVLIGENLTLGSVAGRCSAARAEGMRRLRDDKLYKRCTALWEDFCVDYLGVSRAEADRTIQLLREFGPAYFHLAQFTRISPETYRAIEPALKNGALHCGGEIIELVPSNSRRISAAVARLRRELPPVGESTPRPELYEPEVRRRLAKLDKRCLAILREFDLLYRPAQRKDTWAAYGALIRRTWNALSRLVEQIGPE